jgi:tRNA 2-selenouridine synthase
VNLPDELYANIVASPLIEITKSDSERIRHIAEEYGSLPQNELLEQSLDFKKNWGEKEPPRR